MPPKSAEPTPQLPSSASAKRRGRSLGRMVSFLLMLTVVLVVYWEEVGLDKIFLQDDGPTELTWKIRQGPGWSVWDQESVLYSDSGYACKWVNFTSHLDPSKKATICAHPSPNDYISSKVVSGTPHMDCLLETRQWETKHQKQIYLEIGAHIGVCALELLLNTQAQVVLVEAHKYNIFSLTSTFKQNPKFLDRVTVVPLALGNEPTANADMELLKVEDYASAAINPSSLGNIVMERLDNILNPGGIQQVSLHINGYECNVMDGAVKVLKKVSRITYTVAPTLMEKHGCSKELLLAKFQALGKEPKWYRDTGRLRPISINIKGGFKGVAIQVK